MLEQDSRMRSARLIILLVAALFFSGTLGLSWWRWWTFQYRTFDLAFYIQGLWLALRGEGTVSLLDVSIMGNHAEPIVFLILPLFALSPHAMTLVGVQTAALASMPFTGWRIARHLGYPPLHAALLAALTLVVPATGFIGLHEFHPEAFAAPLLLLAIEAKLRRQTCLFWLWFALATATKENVALLLIAWCVIDGWKDRNLGVWRQWKWNIAPMLFAAVWLGVYLFLLSPWLNAGRVGYGNLYSHLGTSGTDIAIRFFTEPQRVLNALGNALTQGNLVWVLLASFAAIPVLRPRWLLVAAPVLLQHLLSWRTSEWSIHFHYAAPLVPLLWIATVEALRDAAWREWGIAAALAGSLLLQVTIGPYRAVVQEWHLMAERLWQRELRAGFVDTLARDPSLNVTVGWPYLSHLATRRELHSLHFILKGTYTLSLERYVPNYEPDAVLIDYDDSATFNKEAGFYHPARPARPARPDSPLPALPSSDELLHAFFVQQNWVVQSAGPVSLFLRSSSDQPVPPIPAADSGTTLYPHTILRDIRLSYVRSRGLQIETAWNFTAPREHIPWMNLRLQNASRTYFIFLGMCAPHIASGPVLERHNVPLPPAVPDGNYELSVVIFDQQKAIWVPGAEGAVLYKMGFEQLHLEHSEPSAGE
ncbi:DUF2079 domain-containing protein [Verrucomicrobiota bacterium sgz303538]